MASNRDILDAQKFNRARVTTAFTSGLPGGRELEPRSGMTPLIIGAILTIVLIAVALVMQRFTPTLPNGWQNNYLLVIKDTGARYYTINGVMHPVTNITSAKLLTPAGSFNVDEVSADKVNGIPRGGEIGLTDAPDDVPAASSLTQGPWTACASSTAIHTWIDTTPTGYAPTTWALVSNTATDKASDTKTTDYYLVAKNPTGTDALRYQIDNRAAITALQKLTGDQHLTESTAQAVPAGWLNLVDVGSALTFQITDAGTASTGLTGSLASAKVGQLVDVTQDSVTTHYMVEPAGKGLAQLTDMAYELYMAYTDLTVVGQPISADLADVATLIDSNQTAFPGDWPASAGTLPPSGTLPCLQRPMAGSDHTVSLGSIPTHGFPTTGGATVPGGQGVLLDVATGGTMSGALRLLSDSGFVYGLGGQASDTLGRLGYATSDVLTVPQSWAALLPAKNNNTPALSAAAAEATVT